MVEDVKKASGVGGFVFNVRDKMVEGFCSKIGKSVGSECNVED